MDLTVRDWMVIIGVLLIVAVLLDAYRRVRLDRREKVRVSLTSQVSDENGETDEALHWLKELPNGGARVIGRRDLLRSGKPGVPGESAEPGSEPEESSEPEASGGDSVEGRVGDKDEAGPGPLQRQRRLAHLAGVATTQPPPFDAWVGAIDAAIWTASLGL